MKDAPWHACLVGCIKWLNIQNVGQGEMHYMACGCGWVADIEVAERPCSRAFLMALRQGLRQGQRHVLLLISHPERHLGAFSPFALAPLPTTTAPAKAARPRPTSSGLKLGAAAPAALAGAACTSLHTAGKYGGIGRRGYNIGVTAIQHRG